MKSAPLPSNKWHHKFILNTLLMTQIKKYHSKICVNRYIIYALTLLSHFISLEEIKNFMW